MVALNTHPVRALSPITELTTPTSLRTLQLPLEEADYLSERRTSYEEEDASVYSRDSADTVKDGRHIPHAQQEGSSTPTRHRTISLPGPNIPPRSPKRAVPTRWKSSVISLHRQVAEETSATFPPKSTPLPGGLLPPPRTASTAKPKLIKRVTPPPSPRPGPFLDDDTRKRLTEAFSNPEAVDDSASMIDEEVAVQEVNMAGVGAGRSLASPYSGSVSPNSVHAVTPIPPGSRGSSPSKPTFNSQGNPVQGLGDSYHLEHHTLHRIPVLDPAPTKKASPRSRPKSLKKRPNSYHGSRPGSLRSRPNSFNGSLPKTDPSRDTTKSALGLDIEMEKNSESIDDSQQDKIASAKSTVRPTLHTRQSDSSLPIQTDTARSASPSGRSTRRRRVSSILSAIFGSSSPDPEHVARKLSKKIRVPSNSGTSRGSTPPSPTSPVVLTESPGIVEQIGPVQSAIRTSGTFGIRDDGSEVSKLAQSPIAKPDHERTDSGNGSVITHSDGVKRILYVENPIPTPSSVDLKGPEGTDVFFTPRDMPVPSTPDDKPIETPFVTPPLIPLIFGPEINETTRPQPDLLSVEGPVGTNIHPELPHRQSFPPHLPAVGISYPKNHVLSTDHFGLGALYPRHASGQTELRGSEISQSAPINYRSSGVSPPPPVPASDAQVDESTQTSIHGSPSKTSRSRPFPRPPSQTTSSLRTPEPTFIAPTPPNTSPPSDLPLLIASHLLSTHAAALMRHSSSMNEASETMRRMARESLDWGGILMRLADKGVRSSASMDGLPRNAAEAGGYEGIPLPRTAASSGKDTGRTGTQGNHGPPSTSPMLSPRQEGYDPIKAAYDNLTALPPRPSVTRNLARAEMRRRKADSLPADLLKEAQRLGNEGWRSLHAAEEAWAVAMGRLSEMLAHPEMNEGAAEGDRGPDATSTRQLGSLFPDSYPDSYESVRVHPSYTSLSPLTTLPFPSTSPVPYSPNYPSAGSAGTGTGLGTGAGYTQSFLPDERDMLSPSSIAATLESHLSYPQPQTQAQSESRPYSAKHGDAEGEGVTMREALNMPLPMSGRNPGGSGASDEGKADLHLNEHKSELEDEHRGGSTIKVRQRHISAPYGNGPIPMIRPDHPFTQHLPADVATRHDVSSPLTTPGHGYSQAGGYTDEHLGLASGHSGSPGAGPGFRDSGVALHASCVDSPLRSGGTRDSDRDTPSRSTMNSSVLGTSRISTVTATATGTKGKKLSKIRHPLRDSSRPSVGSMVGDAPGAGQGFGSGLLNEVEQGYERDREAGSSAGRQNGHKAKKHWWGRKKE